MRVDKDDRYVSEPTKKDTTPSIKLPNFLLELSKTKLIILSLAIVIILLLLSLIIFRSPHKNEPRLLTPPVVNDVSSTDINSNDATINPTNQQNVTSNNAQSESSNSFADSQNNFPSNQSTTIQESSEFVNEATNTTIKQPVTPDVIAPNATTNSMNHHQPENSQRKINKNLPEKKEIHLKEEKTNSARKNQLKNDHYAIQLSASTSAENLKKFVQQNNITDYQIYETKRNDKQWFILIKGNYSSSDEAKNAIKSLPSALQKSNPWVKSGATINKEKVTK